MSTETFNKNNLDLIFRELAKEYKKLGGKNMPAEIILVGGAAIIENYGFRNMTTDIDAVITASSIMKDAIENVGNRMNLPIGWLNDDFKHTDSYSTKLSEISVYYKSYYNVLNIRTVTAEFLIAMKLKAGRKYKNDLSDIVGILYEHKINGNEITKDSINKAIIKLYGNIDNIPNESKIFSDGLFNNSNYETIYNEILKNEKQAKEILIDFNETYANVLNSKNANDILKILENKNKQT